MPCARNQAFWHRSGVKFHADSFMERPWVWERWRWDHKCLQFRCIWLELINHKILGHRSVERTTVRPNLAYVLVPNTPYRTLPLQALSSAAPGSCSHASAITLSGRRSNQVGMVLFFSWWIKGWIYFLKDSPQCPYDMLSSKKLRKGAPQSLTWVDTSRNKRKEAASGSAFSFILIFAGQTRADTHTHRNETRHTW